MVNQSDSNNSSVNQPYLLGSNSFSINGSDSKSKDIEKTTKLISQNIFTVESSCQVTKELTIDITDITDLEIIESQSTDQLSDDEADPFGSFSEDFAEINSNIGEIDELNSFDLKKNELEMRIKEVEIQSNMLDTVLNKIDSKLNLLDDTKKTTTVQEEQKTQIEESEIKNKSKNTDSDVVKHQNLIDKVVKVNESDKKQISETIVMQVPNANANIIVFEKVDVDKFEKIKDMHKQMLKDGSINQDELQLLQKEVGKIDEDGNIIFDKHPNKKAILINDVPLELRDKLDQIDFNNPPPGIILRDIKEMTEKDKKEIAKLLNNYFESSLELFQLQNQFALLIASHQNDKKHSEFQHDLKKEATPHKMQNSNRKDKSPTEKTDTSQNETNKDIDSLQKKISIESAKKANQIKQMLVQKRKIDQKKSEEVQINHEKKLLKQGMLEEAYLISTRKSSDLKSLTHEIEQLNNCFKLNTRLTSLELANLNKYIINEKINLENTEIITVLNLVSRNIQKDGREIVLCRKLSKIILALAK